MHSRYLRIAKRSSEYNNNVDVFIERLKKVRALNCNPEDVGIGGYTLKRMPFNKLNVLTKLF